MKRVAIALIIACVGVLTCATPVVSAQSTDSTLLRMLTSGGAVFSDHAMAQADSAWRWGFQTRKEPALCVASQGFAYGRAANGKPFVLVLAYATAPEQTPRVKHQDSLTVLYDKAICGDSLPSWHGHITDNGMRYRPSPCDRHAAAVRRVPFHIQQGDVGRPVIYFPDPSARDSLACGPHN